MIKASATMTDKKGEGKLVILGLSAGNVQRLMAGQPIKVELDELIGEHSPRIAVLLVGGETEQSIESDLREHFTIGEVSSDG